MQPAIKGLLSYAQMQELLDEERAKTDHLRGHLQNCVNYLERAKRKHPHDGGNYCIAIVSANTALYETLIK